MLTIGEFVLYHEWNDDDPSRNVMELQQPITP